MLFFQLLYEFGKALVIGMNEAIFVAEGQIVSQPLLVMRMGSNGNRLPEKQGLKP
jgi:murein DD-endopeptidase MepM/ murein hydrolase activator NlpD